MKSNVIKTRNLAIQKCWELIKLSYERKRSRKKSLSILLFFIYLNLSAATYYISPTGNDGGIGSTMFPWKTLANACRRTVYGDIIFINPGKYIEYEKSYLPSGVNIDGKGETSHVVGAHIILEGYGGNQFIRNIKLDGNNIDGNNNIFITDRYNVVINNCIFTNYRLGNYFYASEQMEYAIEVRYSNNIEIHHNTIEAGIRCIMANRDINIHHNIIGKTTMNSNPEVGLHLSDIDKLHVWNNSFKNVATAITVVSYGTTILRDIYIYCNLMTDMGVSSPSTWGYGSGINFGGYSTGIARNINVINNTISANPGSRQTMIGIWLPTVGDVKWIIIRNNIIRGFQYASVFAAGPQPRMDSLYIENNLFYENAILGTGFALTNLPYFTNVELPKYYIEKNNVVGNPLFISTSDYHLQESSPAQSNGVYTSWITVYHSDDNYFAPPNIGAFNDYPSIIKPPSPVYEKDELLVYPVPASEYITVLVKDPTFHPTRIQIIDYLGKIVMDEDMFSDEIVRLPIDLPTGFYFIRVINSQGGMIMQKIIIQRFGN